MQYQTKDNQGSIRRKLVVMGAEIFVHEEGQGHPILLMHGSPDTHDMWLPLMNHLTDHVRCFAIDLPGFGQSTLPWEFSLTLDNMADFVSELLVALAIDEAITLVTTDFGGHYGMAFAAKYPELVRGIAISNTNFFTDYDWHFFAKLYRMPLIGELLLAVTTRATTRNALKQAAHDLPDSYIDRSYDVGLGAPSVRKSVLRMYRERSSTDFAGWENKLLAVLEHTPALVMWGDRDPFIDPAYADRYVGADIHHFDVYSHWLPLEAPAEYAGVLVPWLNGL